ncbi:MAG: phosphohydrolase [Faecalibacterium sp.]|nr:phosphohydrolase [Ruminococcus sp.]MCM1393048.1 phosphohydrolase [Ruminococcus sp.]MCM1486288.1 phosphohydrolase [Faecalibacterium sp.]
MSCILTYTKRGIDPCEPDSSSIAIEDIAHALSLLCRSGGHFPSFYSVGQHSIACAKEAKARNYTESVQLACLLHDASEAYIADITRPVKQRLSDYLEYEKKLQKLIYEKFLGFVPDEVMRKQISSVDDCMLYHEFMALMNTPLFEDKPEIHIDLNFAFRGFDTVEKEFLQLYRELN